MKNENALNNAKYEIITDSAWHKTNGCVVEIINSIGAENNSILHWHHALEIIYIIEGSVRYFINGQSYEAFAGDTILINSGYFHQTENMANGQRLSTLLIMIPDEFFSEAVPESAVPCFSLPSPSYRKAADIFSSIANRFEEDLSYRSLYFKKELLNIVYFLYTDCGFSLNRANMEKELSPLKKCIRYVNAHYTEPVTIETAAGIAGLQPHYFCRYFKKRTGISFHQYLSRIRLDIALNLANKHSEFTLLDCALQAGFSTEKTLIDWCRKIYSCTPSEYLHSVSYFSDPRQYEHQK